MELKNELKKLQDDIQSFLEQESFIKKSIVLDEKRNGELHRFSKDNIEFSILTESLLDLSMLNCFSRIELGLYKHQEIEFYLNDFAALKYLGLSTFTEYNFEKFKLFFTEAQRIKDKLFEKAKKVKNILSQVLDALDKYDRKLGSSREIFFKLNEKQFIFELSKGCIKDMSVYIKDKSDYYIIHQIDYLSEKGNDDELSRLQKFIDDQLKTSSNVKIDSNPQKNQDTQSSNVKIDSNPQKNQDTQTNLYSTRYLNPEVTNHRNVTKFILPIVCIVATLTALAIMHFALSILTPVIAIGVVALGTLATAVSGFYLHSKKKLNDSSKHTH